MEFKMLIYSQGDHAKNLYSHAKLEEEMEIFQTTQGMDKKNNSEILLSYSGHS